MPNYYVQVITAHGRRKTVLVEHCDDSSQAAARALAMTGASRVVSASTFRPYQPGGDRMIHTDDSDATATMKGLEGLFDLLGLLLKALVSALRRWWTTRQARR